MFALFCGACVRAVSWINGVLFGCAEDAAEALRGTDCAAEVEEGFRAGARWSRRGF